jgi:hypothetical protein
MAGPIADANPIMRVRPQSLYAPEVREADDEDHPFPAIPTSLDPRPPIAALLDGYPVQNHALLANRLDVEEVDITGADAALDCRFHGTAMASLILHGDLQTDEPPLDRALKVVPILGAAQGLHEETTPLDKLPIMLVYRAVLALTEGRDGEDPRGRHVVIVNHSVCDQEAPFSRRPSAWAKLLDYLANRYALLFIVSAGNNHHAFDLDDYASLPAFEDADDKERQIVILRSLEQSKGTRSILSPAETMNGLTIGALHRDACDAEVDLVEPFDQLTGVGNLGTGFGLGINRAIKPDMVEAGGRQFVAAEMEGGIVAIRGVEASSSGQLVAAPDIFGGSTTKTLHSTGTSNAAALVTRNGIRVADILESLFAEDGVNWSEQATRAVTLKALLVHGCSWGLTHSLLDAIYPPGGQYGWQRRHEAISRYIGFGRFDPSRIWGADGSRITLLGDDLITAEESHQYRIPVPRAMLDNRDLRRVIMTLAWSSPISPDTNRYRGVALDLVDHKGERKFWHGAKSIKQPHPDAARRGTLQHMVLEGKNLMKLTSGGSFLIGVQARAGIPGFEDVAVPYGLAVTLEMGQPVRQDLNADVISRIRAKTALPIQTPINQRVRR